MRDKSILKDIESREEIHQLISNFYDNVRSDDFLGPIFKRSIPDSLWPWHIDKLTDFWETVVFANGKYTGNPRKRHQSVDRMENARITQDHFARWLQLWFKNVQMLYSGPRADEVMDRARIMSTAIYLGIVAHRKDGGCPFPLITKSSNS